MSATDPAGAISPDEREKFVHHLYQYRADDVIIHEGAVDQNTLYLLRQGSVGIFKRVENQEIQLSQIDAVNFFGEMALVVGGKRTATVRVLSNEAVVYKFQSFDLRAIYSNPAWSEILIRRLCNDLSEMNDKLVSVETERSHLSGKLRAIVDQSSLLFSVLLTLQGDVAADIVMASREWRLVRAMRLLMAQFIDKNLPDVAARIKAANGRAALERLRGSGEYPEVEKLLETPSDKTTP
jgi:CRP-like cAMP-binding protein